MEKITNKQISMIVFTVLATITIVTTITAFKYASSARNDFLDGIDIGHKQAYEQMLTTQQEVTSYAQYIITTMNAMPIPTEDENPIDEYAFIDSEERWN